MLLSDQLTLDAPRRTKDGYLAVRAKAARTGVYKYAGYEVDPENKHGLRDQAVVNVLRDEQTVFDRAAIQSFIGKPVTDDHPTTPVTKDNWREHARGTIMGALRDGEYVAFDLLLTDAATIDKVEAGKRDLSNGYEVALEYGSFTAADGTICPVRQAAITGGNHVAVVKVGRAGPDCAIQDSIAHCDANPAAVADYSQEKPTMKIKIGDAEVDATNGEAVRIAVDALNTKLGTLTAENATLKTAVEAKDGEITGLNAKLADATVTPEKLQQLADARADIIAKAQALKPGITVDGKSNEDIRKEAITAKLGDAAKDMADAAVEGAFLALTKDAQPQQRQSVQPIGTPRTMTNDNASVRDLARASQY
jgi:hypothetical protein